LAIALAVLITVVVPSTFAPSFYNGLLTWVREDASTLAVLPFRNIGNDPANQIFCDGLVETLTSKLSQIEPLQHAFRIVPSSDVRIDEIGSARQAQRILGAALVVTGSVQRMTGSNTRLTINLVDARTQTQLASQTIDAEFGNLARLQDDVVMKVAGLLKAALPQSAKELLNQGNPSVPAAADFYIEGRGYLRHYENAESVKSAIVLFQHALDLDGRYALAHAALGEAYWRQYELTKDLHLVELASRSCQEAVKLNDRLAPVYVTLALIDNGTGHYEDAIEQSKKSLQINFLEADAYRELAKAYQSLGRFGDAESTYHQAIAARSNDWSAHSALGLFYWQYGRYQDAETEFNKVLDLAPLNVRALSNLGAVYQMMHRYEEAEKTLKKSLAIRPTARGFNNLGTLYFFYLKRPADATRMFEQAVQQAIENNDRDYRYWRNLAAAYSWNPTDHEKAQAAFKKAIELGEQQRQTNARNQALLVALADCYAMVGEGGRALDYVSQAMNIAPLDNNQMATVAGVYEQLGQRSRALEWIGRALRGGYSRDMVDSSPSLAQLRSDPAFETQTKP
jgi:tetratricopeptide (TPR) repeat protein